MPKLVLDVISSSEFWAAIVGAVVGGLIAALTQWRFMKVQQEQQRLDRVQQKKEREQERAQDKLERDQALATSLMFKLTELAASLVVTKDHVDRCIAQAGADRVGRDTQLWQVLRPVLNVSDPVHFTANEMSLLLAQANDKAFGQVLMLDSRHNSIMAALRTFNTMRTDLDEKVLPLAILDRIEGGRVDLRFREEDVRHLRPRMIELNSIVQHLRDELPKDVAEARQAIDDALNLFRKNLGLKFNVKIVNPPANNAPAPGA